MGQVKYDITVALVHEIKVSLAKFRIKSALFYDDLINCIWVCHESCMSYDTEFTYSAILLPNITQKII